MTRPLLATMGPALAGAGAVLSIATIPSIPKIIIGSFCVLFATFGIHTFNDWVDKERDKKAWPMRAIPSGRVCPKTALTLSIFYFLFSLVLCFFFINPITSFVLFLAIFFGCLYCLYLRDMVGYLSLPFIIGLFPIGGWTAFSPDTLFRSSLPWLLYSIAWLWQAGHIMVHSAGHPIKEVGGKRITEIKGFFFSTTPFQSAILGFVFLFLTFCFSILLFFITPLGFFYLLISSLAGIYVLIPSIRFLLDRENKRKSLAAFNAASNYLIFLSLAIIIEIFVRTVMWEYLLSFFYFLRIHFGLWLWPIIFAGLATTIGLTILGFLILKLALQFLISKKRRTLKTILGE